MAAQKESKSIYRVLFSSQGKIYEVYARSVEQGELFGFVRIEGLLFGERTQVVVDPAEEQLKLEFEGVQSFQVPMQSVLRVDDVNRRGTNRVRPESSAGEGSNLASFPSPLLDPNGPKRSDRG